MSRLLAIAAALCLISTAASAQTSSIMVHYRAYQNALERSDLASAEASAAAALAAAETANDARQGVLALNLASVRFLRGDAANAAAPARRALELAEQNPDGPVDPEMARLLLARAELATNNAGAETRLETALAAAQSANLDDAEIYDASLELAVWASTNQQFQLAQNAWQIADTHAAGSRYPANLARARAKLSRSIAIFQEEMRLRGDTQFNYENAVAGYRALSEAQLLLQQLASVDVPGGDITVAQQAYADIVAWRGIWHAKFYDDEMELPVTTDSMLLSDGLDFDASDALAAPRCHVNLDLDEAPRYPSRAAERGELAALAVRIRINAAGEVEDATVVSRIGSEDFERAMNAVRDEWTATRLETSPPDCRMEMSVIRAFTFRIGGSSGVASPAGMGYGRDNGVQRTMGN